MFHMAQQLEWDNCFRCGEKIETSEELSMDHIVDWYGRDNEYFWDVMNIAFSHLSCNLSSGRTL